MRRILILSFVLLTALGVRSVRAQDYKVIVNEANPVSTMTTAEVAQLFLKKRTTWPSGGQAMPVDQTSGRARAAFSQEVLGRDISAMRLYWQQQVFSGRATAPDEKPSDAAVMAVVRDNPGAIGYVSASAPISGVKILVVK
jgi:ABC-type phosphate transport system substrate-binding protein